MKSPAKLTFETILLIAVVVAVLVTPVISEAAHHGAGPPSLAEFDADGDGFLSEDEFNKGRAERHAEMAKEGRPMHGMSSAPGFADFDTDGDGKLSADEFATGHQLHMGKMRADRHGKGKGMHKGHGQRVHASFEDIDGNGDGCIDKAELDAHHAMEQAGEQ